MITKKLAVPLVNEKILSQAQHVYIATAGITDTGFDFLRSRIPANCKISIVTSLHGATSPNVLHRILRHYQGRIALNLYTRNVLHANLFIFDLPYRKSVGFVGSGTLSLEGLKDHEELFWKVTDAKEIESLLSWYTSYFEFGTPLNESLIQQYEKIYPQLRANEILSRKMSEHAVRLSAFNLDAIKFKNQFFKKEELSSLTSHPDPPVSADDSLTKLESTLRQTPEGSMLLKGYHSSLVWDELKGRWIRLAREESPFSIEMGISPTEFGLRINVPGSAANQKYRHAFLWKLQEEDFTKELFESTRPLADEYSIEVNGVDRPLSSFQNEQVLSEFIRSDYGSHFSILISIALNPGDPKLAADKITMTLHNELKKLGTLIAVLGRA